jgi:hypothetical protein
VRYLSFYYTLPADDATVLRAYRADHDLLARELRGADGVVLDLQFRLGAIMGRQPAHAFTMHRHALPVAGPGGEDLGRFTVAVSHSEYREGSSIEGEPLRLDWEASDDFDHRATWVTDALAQARRLLINTPK